MCGGWMWAQWDDVAEEGWGEACCVEGLRGKFKAGCVVLWLYQYLSAVSAPKFLLGLPGVHHAVRIPRV